MKAKVIFLAMVMLALCRPADAEYRMDYSRWARLASSQGAGELDPNQLGPCIYARIEDCENAKAEAARQYGSDGYVTLIDCVPCGRSGGSSGGDPEQQIANALGKIIKFFLDGTKPDSSKAKIDKENAIKLQKEEEQKKEAARIAGNQAWIDLQNIEQGKRTFDDAKKLEARKDLLDKMGTIDSGDLTFKTIGTDFFGTSKPMEVRLQSKETGSHPTSDLKPAAVPDIPEPVPEPVDSQQVETRKRQLATLIQNNVKFLQDIEIKLSDAKVQIKEAESKKEAAQIKLEEAKNIAATAKPEEKPRADELEAQAMAALQSADDELEKAKQSENDMIKEKEKIENEAKKLNAEIQAEGKK